MIISEKLRNELAFLEETSNSVLQNNSLTDLQIENFLRNLEKTRYNILTEIKINNKNAEFEYEKIKTIDDEYKAELEDNVLKIYVPEVMPSYKNIKTHTHKRILLNIAEITKNFAGLFETEVFIYIKIFDKIKGWDIDNRFIKPISDALILSNVIKDDNINNMFYMVQGKNDTKKPYTEVFVMDGQYMEEWLIKLQRVI